MILATFVKSPRMGDLINQAMFYQVRPSEMAGLTEYTAYCFDEVARVIYLSSLKDDGATDYDKVYNRTKTTKEFAEFITGSR